MSLIDENIVIGNESTTLAQLAGIDFGGVDVKRMFTFPVGYYKWEIIADPEPPILKAINKKGAVVVPCKCIDVLGMVHPSEAPDGDPSKIIGKVKAEIFFLTTHESLGYFKAFVVDVGAGDAFKNLNDLTPLVGKRFTAHIVHRPNKDDRDAPPFINFNNQKIVAAA